MPSSDPTQTCEPAPGGARAPDEHAIGPTEPLDHASFARLYAEGYRSFCLIAASWLGTAHGAEDVVQDAAIDAMRKMSGFRAGTSFRAWMAAFVRNHARNAARSRRRERAARSDSAARNEGGSAGHTASGEEPAAPDGWAASALGRLSETQRECLLLRVVGGMSHAEIGRALGLTENTVRSHVHRARRVMAEAAPGMTIGGV